MLRIDFPQGGRLVDLNGDTFLEGNLLRIGFGPDSATQIPGADGQPGFLEFTPPSGQTLRVKRGELTFAELAAVMGLAPGEGIRLLVHGKTELLWKGGTVTRDGIRGGVFALTRPALGLPGNLGGYEKSLTDLSSREPIGISVATTCWPNAVFRPSRVRK